MGEIFIILLRSKRKNSHHLFFLWENAAIPESFPTASLFCYLYSGLYETKNVIGFVLSMNSWDKGGIQHHNIMIKKRKWLILFSECMYTVSLLSTDLNSVSFRYHFVQQKISTLTYVFFLITGRYGQVLIPLNPKSQHVILVSSQQTFASGIWHNSHGHFQLS